MTKLPVKDERIVALILPPYNTSMILKPEGHTKGEMR